MALLELQPSRDVQAISQFLHKCFPENELRSQKDLERLLNQPTFHTWCYIENDQIQAVLCGFVFEEYVFFEFLAVDEALRGQGMGRNILMHVIEKLAKPVILEVEPMHDTNSQRRIRFYERLGFHLCDTPYRMPKLDETHGDLELKLMSYPDPLTPEQFQQRVQHIYRYVYEKTI